jgi:hypothetical protein
MKCSNCQEEVPDHVRSCVVCGADVGYPNVRAALRDEEVSALNLRVTEVEQDATLRGCKSVLAKFRDSAANSSVVVARSLGRISVLLSSDTELYTTFYKAVGGEARLPEDNECDKARQPVDTMLFPFYAENIRFGSLSLDLSGISTYGDYFMVLKELAIKDRATVFEENSIRFIKRLGIVPGDPLPLGYRATWMNRSSLVAAKLGKRLTTATTEREFPQLLANSAIPDPDFIEVHIYGPIHRRAIKHISGPQPRQKADKVLLKSISKKLREIDATLEICK